MRHELVWTDATPDEEHISHECGTKLRWSHQIVAPGAIVSTDTELGKPGSGVEAITTCYPPIVMLQK